ncbi:unnamed protein product [Rhizoctonia solani]|uniref:Aminoglycoside phosphotransferase domain-containing protein n=1 Tax=Rhizoctonia solani TaxID=456999 RepID=A0A8H2XGK3_9AGAM|nr:unnamed protein product [Rhizoctonia solani]
MIMQKIPGISPHGDKWKSLPCKVKCNVVKQVAAHLAILFSQRFEQAGSLYFAGDGDLTHFKVGPIVSLPFYRMIDGVVEHPDMPLDVRETLDCPRGPYKSTSDYLASHLRAELLKMDRFRSATLSSICSDDAVPIFEKAQEVMRLAVELCDSYPGDRAIPPNINTPNRSYTFMLDDFRLANILIDENTGHVNGYVNFEATTLVPLWQSATVPQWIPDPDGDMAGWYGGTPEDQKELWSTFHTTMDHLDHGLTGGEWRRAYEAGKHFRDFADRIHMGIPYWAKEMEDRVKDRMEWAQQHPGVGMPDKDW